MDTTFWKKTSSAGNINGLADPCSPKSANQSDIATIRADLAAWSAGKPKAVQNAVANLVGWLLVASGHPDREFNDIDALACTARAVETLRHAVRDSPAGR